MKKMKSILLAMLSVLTVSVGAIGMTACDFTMSDDSQINSSESVAVSDSESVAIGDSDNSLSDSIIDESSMEVSSVEESSSEEVSSEEDSSVVESFSEEVSSEEDSSVDDEEKTSSEGLKYTLSNDKTYYIVSGVGTCNDEKIVIPSTYDDLPVKEIGVNAFYLKSEVKEIIIPVGLTSIGVGAFQGCRGLMRITIPKSVTNIEASAFWICYAEPVEGEVIRNSRCFCNFRMDVYYEGEIEDWCRIKFCGGSNLYGNYYSTPISHLSNLYMNNQLMAEKTDLVISGDIFEIKDVTFAGWNWLQKVTISDKVTSLGVASFYECNRLTEIIIPDSVTYIGRYAFTSCSNLTKIEIPDSVASIGFHAFNGCSSLTQVVIPDGVTSIGDSALYNCSSLTEVVIPDSVTSIGNYAFRYCSSLTSITFEGTVEQWNAISKGRDWNYEVPATEVVCKDGTVTLK